MRPGVGHSCSKLNVPKSVKHGPSLGVKQFIKWTTDLEKRFYRNNEFAQKGTNCQAVTPPMTDVKALVVLRWRTRSHSTFRGKIFS